jgi:hypothetical protein
MPKNDLPRYVERPDNQAVAQPLRLDNTTLYLFPIESDVAAQQATLDRYLNAPSGGAAQYRAFFPRVFLYFARFGALRPQRRPDSERGFLAYQECGVWVPALSLRQAPGHDVAYRLSLFPLYMFVDDCRALVTGRETYGIPKEWARLVVPPAPGAGGIFSVRPVIFDRFSPTTLGQEEQLLQLVRVSGTQHGAAAQVWDDAGAALKAIAELVFGGPTVTLPGPGLAISVIDTFLRGPTLAMLKQLRDVSDAHRACYQAGVEVATAGSFRRAGFLEGRYDLNVKVCDSHPVVRELGLATSTFSSIRGVFVDMDVVFEDGVELWRAS